MGKLKNENRQSRYKKVLELELILSLLLHIGVIQGVKKAELNSARPSVELKGLEGVEIPLITYTRNTPLPPKPTVVIPTEDPFVETDLPNYETYDPMDYPLPQPSDIESEVYEYTPCEIDPIPIGGCFL